MIHRAALRASWAPIAVLVLHSVLGRVLGHEPYVDPLAHFSGGAAMAYFVRAACSVRGGALGAPSALALDLLAFGLAATAAVLWEFGEFLLDVFYGTRIQLSVANTMRDMMLGMAGAVVCVTLGRLRSTFYARRSR